MNIILNTKTIKKVSYPNLQISHEIVEVIPVTFQFLSANASTEGESSALFSTKIDGAESSGVIQVVFEWHEHHSKSIQHQAEDALRRIYGEHDHGHGHDHGHEHDQE